MTRREFRRSMQCGLGRCVWALQSEENREEYRNEVLWGCLHNLSFDTQCEGTRAEYVYRLVSAYSDSAFFVEPICEKFETMSIRNTWERLHMCELLELFAKNGNMRANQTLEDQYHFMYERILKKKRFESYDYLRDAFENLAIYRADQGIDAFLKTAEDFGVLLLHSKHYRESFQFDFDGFLYHIEEAYSRKRILRALQKGGRDSAGLRSFTEAYTKYTLIEPYKRRGNISVPTVEELVQDAAGGDIAYLKRIHFRKMAKEEAKAEFAKRIEREHDPDMQARLLAVFTNASYPGAQEKLIEFYESEHEKLRNTAQMVFATTRGSKIREYALAMIEQRKDTATALSAIIRNYHPTDKQLLLSELYQLKVSYDNVSRWHNVLLHIRSAKDDGISLPREVFEYMYDRSLCSCCRKDAVSYLSKHGWLTERLINECVYDSNRAISQFVQQYYRSKIRKAVD